jgi:hypothetical protein
MMNMPSGKIGVVIDVESDLSKGDIGEIVIKSPEGGYEVIGKDKGYIKTCTHKVRILEEGELIEVRYS